MVRRPIATAEGSGYYKIRDIGKGLSISLPKAFANYEGLHANMYVELIWGNHILTVRRVGSGQNINNMEGEDNGKSGQWTKYQ